MSRVTDVVLCARDEDLATEEMVAADLRANASGALKLVALAESFGGTRHGGHAVWAGALNDLDGFLDAVTRAPWLHPADVAVIAWPEDKPMVIFWGLPEHRHGGVQPSPFGTPDALSTPAARNSIASQ